jgi:hypothetical protein
MPAQAGWSGANWLRKYRTIPLHRLSIAPYLGRDPPRAPAKTMKPLHHSHLVRRPHRLSPPVHAVRKNAY